MAFPTTEEIKKKVDKLFGHENPITCRCGQTLNEMMCGKDGPNKGRKFYSCRDPTCKYFVWSDERDEFKAPAPARKRQRSDDMVRAQPESPARAKRQKKEESEEYSEFAAAAERLSFESKQQRDLLQSVIEALKMSLGMLGEIKGLLDMCPKSCISPGSSSGDETAPLVNTAPVPVAKS